jgi:hypothetical protein
MSTELTKSTLQARRNQAKEESEGWSGWGQSPIPLCREMVEYKFQASLGTKYLYAEM